MERLRFLKGAVQDANRLNRWLRAADLATLEVTPNDPTQVPQAEAPAADAATAGQRFLVALKEPDAERSIPRGLADHRLKLATKSAKSDSVRTRLARMSMAEVKRYHVQELVDALAAEGKLSATLRQEQATLRNLFNHARVSWCWAHPVENPATTLKIKWKDNARSRVMSKAEQARLDEAIADCRNHLVGPTITLYTETAMRASEPIANARWCDVDWNAKVLKLADSKNDKRDVPLSPTALQALLELKELTGGRDDEPVVSITYEAIKASWGRACERAGVTDLRIQDLRHTAATRMALKSGNVFLVKSLTGHKTMEMLARYVNVTAHDVVEFMHAQPSQAPAGTAAPGDARGGAAGSAPSVSVGRADPAADRNATSKAPDVQLPVDSGGGAVIQVDFARRQRSA